MRMRLTRIEVRHRAAIPIAVGLRTRRLAAVIARYRTQMDATGVIRRGRLRGRRRGGVLVSAIVIVIGITVVIGIAIATIVVIGIPIVVIGVGGRRLGFRRS